MRDAGYIYANLDDCVYVPSHLSSSRVQTFVCVTDMETVQLNFGEEIFLFFVVVVVVVVLERRSESPSLHQRSEKNVKSTFQLCLILFLSDFLVAMLMELSSLMLQNSLAESR